LVVSDFIVPLRSVVTAFLALVVHTLQNIPGVPILFGSHKYAYIQVRYLIRYKYGTLHTYRDCVLHANAGPSCDCRVDTWNNERAPQVALIQLPLVESFVLCKSMPFLSAFAPGEEKVCLCRMQCQMYDGASVGLVGVSDAPHRDGIICEIFGARCEMCRILAAVAKSAESPQQQHCQHQLWLPLIHRVPQKL
jgi:hypothetical protein